MRAIVWGILLAAITLVVMLFTALVTAGLNSGNPITYSLTVALLTLCALSAIGVAIVICIIYLLKH